MYLENDIQEQKPLSVENKSISPQGLIAQLINNSHSLSVHLATTRTSNSCLMLDYVLVINFCIIIPTCR